jgi:Ser/Thr protein kinase RdoA (MazF antagonist)
MIEEALSLYDFTSPEIEFIRHNENITYAITDCDKKYLLRIHKAAEGLNFSFQCGETPRIIFINSEIELLLNICSNLEIEFQRPLINKTGQYVSCLSSGDFVTVLSWVGGQDMRSLEMSDDTVYRIGQMIGTLHNITSGLPSLARYYYDENMINRILIETENAYVLNHIAERFYNPIREYLLYLREFLQERKEDFILIHADLSKANLIYNEGNITPIDFSLSGYSLPEMDLADMLSSLNNDKLRPFLIDGYNSISKHRANQLHIEIYEAFSVILYIAYHHNKLSNNIDSFNIKLDRWCNSIINASTRKLCEVGGAKHE